MNHKRISSYIASKIAFYSGKPANQNAGISVQSLGAEEKSESGPD
jgi:hypothetical protein